MKARISYLRVIGYCGLVAIAIALLICICAILDDDAIRRSVKQQPQMDNAANDTSAAVTATKVTDRQTSQRG